MDLFRPPCFSRCRASFDPCPLGVRQLFPARQCRVGNTLQCLAVSTVSRLNGHALLHGHVISSDGVDIDMPAPALPLYRRREVCRDPPFAVLAAGFVFAFFPRMSGFCASGTSYQCHRMERCHSACRCYCWCGGGARHTDYADDIIISVFGSPA